MNEDNAAKKYFSVRMGVSHVSTSQKMLQMFMMRMMEIRNMCMVICFCKPYLLQINCANEINMVGDLYVHCLEYKLMRFGTNSSAL